MSQEIHVTSAAITDIQRRLRNVTRPLIEEVYQELNSTEVDPLLGIIPAFSLIGKSIVEPVYDHQRRHSRELLDDKGGALAAIDGIIAKLDKVKTTWKAAENANKVEYK